ncbi:hypothetical protein BCV69DRAFT_172069 [Microstroma glucosiphilum]|uniref:Mitochondrial inner membrane protease ATP23 n=1 Tax=Pseudomicrostroma glucosiphilum TaxID=1684307 RepID=A0A316U8E1_9BASI|nr:hypothetical protein BCV69DRAFT_172069 [Pseudomicrostroma glucosiphilum]PWN21497.1 hypothetical protein BCV69DRAFT_172069 [Pseudomicrostroma glucosiphilum]
MTAEAGPSSLPANPPRPIVPSVLRQHFAAYQRSPCAPTPTPTPAARSSFVAPSIFEGWLGGSSTGASSAEAESKAQQQRTVVGAGSVPSDSVWQDHPETQEEARHRERCEKWADQLFKTSPMIRFMTRHLILVSCDPLAPLTSKNDLPRLTIASCPPTMAGGFSPSAPGAPLSDSGIMLCANRMMSKDHLEDTLAHEMVHWWDHCRFKVDWSDLRQHACSEIRASSLSGDCNFSRERGRRNWGLTKQHQACTRRRAVLSVMANEKCTGGKEQAERVVDEVWNSCFSDTRPFDEIY